MGYPLYREVKKHAPATLTHREKLTAMVLADDANDVTRVTFSSVVDPEILQWAMVKNDRDMRKVLTRLVEEKVLERVSGGGNGRVAKYRFLYLTPAGTDGVAGPKETANSATEPEVAGPNQTSYAESEQQEMFQKEPATDAVGGSFRHRSRSKKNLPTPSTSSTTSSTTPAATAADDDDATTKPARKPNRHQVADDLAAGFWNVHGKGRAQPFIAVRGIIRSAIKNGVDRDDLARALDRVAREGRAISGATLDIALGSIHRGGRSVSAPQTAPYDMTPEEEHRALQF